MFDFCAEVLWKQTVVGGIDIFGISGSWWITIDIITDFMKLLLSF